MSESNPIKVDVALLGATGLVGEAMLDVLASRNFPVRTLYPLASERSAGSTVEFKGESLRVENVADFDFSKVQLGLFSAGAEISKEYAPIAADKGCVVIDNTSYFRNKDDIALVVPEINAHRITAHSQGGIIANPNCSTIQLLVALKPIYDAAGIDHMHIATYQAVSGAGKIGVDSLQQQSLEFLQGEEMDDGAFPRRIAFNVVPQAGAFNAMGYSEEEMKLLVETHKILEDPDIKVTATCVRVPVFYGHSEAVHLQTKKPLSASAARDLYADAAGVLLVDDTKEGYASPAELGPTSDKVLVGRLRDDLFNDKGLCLWVVADNIRKGAALNSVQIAEHWLNITQHD